MPKFRPYNSPLNKALLNLGNFGNLVINTYFQYNKFDDYPDPEGADPRNYSDYSKFHLLSSVLLKEFSGVFHPYFSMIKDVVDTFKPYKSSFYVWRDIIQPFRGIGNAIKGVTYLALTILIYTYNIGDSFYLGIVHRSPSLFLGLAVIDFMTLLTGLFDGLNNIVRGATQIVTTPLTWLRMLLRAAITYKQGWPTFEETQYKNVEKLKTNIQKKDKTPDDMIEIDCQMIRLGEKIKKAKKRGQGFANGDNFEGIKEFWNGNIKFVTQNYLQNGTFDLSFNDNPHKQKMALNRLSLFKGKEKASSQKKNITYPAPV